MGRDFEAIVIGSGIGGLAAAAALARSGRRVLVLEQHFQLGGLTQSFVRSGYEFGCGVHYVGGAESKPGPTGRFGRLLDWLTDSTLRFASVGSPYDVVRLPDYEFSIQMPRTAYVEQLNSAFPDETRAIATYFAAADGADSAARKMFAARALPKPVSLAIDAINARSLRRALGTTTAQAVAHIRDPRLASVLTARWALCGMPPQRAPLAAHALATTSLYDGAYYPIGGPARFAETLSATIRQAGGELRTRTEVCDIRVIDGEVAGVSLFDGESIDASTVISAMGAHNTVDALPQDVATPWCDAVRRIEPSCSYVCLYLGFKGDIATRGASSASVWIYETDDVGAEWASPGIDPAPHLFVSFPSLKDPSHHTDSRHTAEVLVMCPWEPFSVWADSTPESRPDDYIALKEQIEDQLLARFKHHFPQLAPMVDFHELSTPLSQASYVDVEKGAMYGLGMSADRLSHPALRVQTPVSGLLLAGQDAAGPGLSAALVGGYMAAASIEPSLWKRLRG